mmetsp:Transcript_7081/g.16091  ORF Transcript_7081/g.16091 Transcript_7081/m.16091 type:complete len:91 (+) Transcript_7081:1249-1521(+)
MHSCDTPDDSCCSVSCSMLLYMINLSGLMNHYIMTTIMLHGRDVRAGCASSGVGSDCVENSQLQSALTFLLGRSRTKKNAYCFRLGQLNN